MTPFLKTVAEYIYEKHQNDIHSVKIVLPNKRARLFFEKYLAETAHKNLLAPEFDSIENFMVNLSGLQLPGKIDLILKLYEVYRQQTEDPEPFYSFLNWGEMIIKEFNELDHYLIDTNKFFDYLNEAKALEMWSPNREELTEIQEKYLKFWQMLKGLYANFNQYLFQNKEAYQGAAFRKTAEQIEQLWEEGVFNQWDKIYFVGFNALSPSEEKVIRHLIKHQKAEPLWDADAYYYKDKQQEAGLFLRKHIPSLNYNNAPVHWIFDDLKTQEKTIEIVRCGSNILQTQKAAKIIEKWAEEDCNESSAVVLADESLLLPLLENMPDKHSGVNITMGYPLKNTPLYNFWLSLIYLYQNQSNGAFYFKNVQQVLSHNAFKLLLNNYLIAEEILKKITSQNIISVDIRNLIDESSFSHEEDKALILTTFPEQKVNIRQTVAIMNQLAEKGLKQADDALWKEYFYNYLKIFNRLQEIMNQYTFVTDFKDLRFLFFRIISQETIDLIGEPLTGVQILGVLETRNLDFKNLIVLSVNEGNLPAGKKDYSFIPFQIKKEFNLPTYQEKDAVFSYHFYRLLQKAENIHLLYSEQEDDKSEKSRFLLQLEWELPKKNPKAKISHYTIEPEEVKMQQSQNILHQEKTETVMKSLEEYLFHNDKGVSPSALISYLTCPLNFYYKYILKIQEVKEVSEEAEDSAIGNVIHKVLYKLYQPLLNQIQHQKNFDFKEQQLEKEIIKAFKENGFDEHQLKKGQNLIHFEVVKEMLRKIIGFDRKNASSKNAPVFTHLEQKISGILSYEGKNIKLSGIADRIQSYEGVPCIVDYKSGKIDSSKLDIKDLNEFSEDLFSNISKNKNKFQLLTYVWMYAQQHPHQENFKAAIISPYKISQGMHLLKIGNNEIISREQINEFENLVLSEIIMDILDKDHPFVHNEKSLYCLCMEI